MNNENKINVPISFQKLKSLPSDPANSICYGKQNQSCRYLVMVYPIAKEKSMPFGNENAVINGIHGALAEDQGLIEVKSGVTKNQKQYIYSIVKSKLKPSGMQYILTMHINMNDHSIKVQAYFDEIGVTGYRDSTIMNKMINDGVIIPPNMDGWFNDPYDSSYKKGLLMNVSESARYDTMFPQHPLSEMRSFVNYIVENN